MTTQEHIQGTLKDLDDIICGQKTYNSDDEKIADINQKVGNNWEYLFKRDACMGNGKNVFHILAEEPRRNDSILHLFKLRELRNATNISKSDLKNLLKMRYGGSRDSPLHLAVKAGFISLIEILFELEPTLITLQNKDGNTSLHVAAISSHPAATELVGMILEKAQHLGIDEDIRLKGNKKGYTPVHLLCSEIPTNEDSDVHTRLNTLISHGCMGNILKLDDIVKENPLHILCSGSSNKMAPKDDMKNPNLVKCLKVLIQNKDNDDVNLPTKDDREMTALHLACRNQFPNLTEILIQHPQIDVTKRDSAGKMAIHYAAETSNKPKGHQCIRALADWSKLKSKIKYEKLEHRESFISYLLRDGDTKEHQKNQTTNQVASNDTSFWLCCNGKKSTETHELSTLGTRSNTALTLCCKAKSAKSVEYILKNANDASSRFATWFSENPVSSYIVSLEPIYDQMPEVLEFLFYEAITIDFEESTETKLIFKTDISVITGDTTRALKSPVSEMTYLNKSENWTEDTREKILLHPLTKCALLAVWQKMFLYKVLWTIINVVWLLLYYNLVPYEFSTAEKGYPTSQVIAAWFLAAITVCHVAFTLVEIIKLGAKYFKGVSLVSTLKKIVSFVATLTKLVLTVIAVCYPCFAVPPTPIAKYSVATGIVLSHILFWRNLSILYLPLGMQVEYLLQTLKRILFAVLCGIPIILGFEKAFRQILAEHFDNDGSSLLSLTKTLVMMTGEFEYSDLFKELDNTTDMDGEDIVGVPKLKTLNLIVFICFLLIVSISFYNLITGLVVEKVTNMKEKIETHIIYNQIRVIHEAQRSIIMKVWSDCLTPRVLNYFFMSYRQIEHSDKKIYMDCELKWYIDKIKPKTFNSTVRSFLGLPTINSNNQRCGNDLPSSVKRKLFDMYENKLIDK